MFNKLYNLIISDVSRLCYRNCLLFFPAGSRILDVGIGNGVMLEDNHALIKDKNFQITGLDINNKYIKHCQKLTEHYGLQDQLQVMYQSVFDFVPQKHDLYDFVLFGMSFMLLPEQGKILERAKTWIKPEGHIVFFQTMFKSRSTFLELIKPKLKYVTSIDFGQVTYEDEFFELLEHRNITVNEDRLLQSKWFKGEYRMIVSQPQVNRKHKVAQTCAEQETLSELNPISQS